MVTLCDRFGREMKEESYFVYIWEGELESIFGIRQIEDINEITSRVGHRLVKSITTKKPLEGPRLNSIHFLQSHCLCIPDNIMELDETSILGYIKMLGIEVQE